MLRLINLKNIFGQDAAIETLTRAYESERLPHGLIFAGPVGVGKGTTARGLAALYLCENPKSNQPCGKCKSCELMSAETHPDYHVVRRQLIRLEKEKSKAIDISVDVIRGFLVEPANLKANMGRGKVFVVEEADLMNAAAQNALLKTLEEPYPQTLIILLTDQPHALLPTIRSRSQIVRFGPLDANVVQRELEKRKIDKSTAAEAAGLANGSLGLALKWIEDGVVASARELIRQLDTIATGNPASELPDWFKKAADAYAEKQLEHDKLASKDQATREALTLYLKIASDHFRTKLTGTTDPAALERVCDAIESVVRAEGYLDSNVNVALSLQQFSSSLQRRFAASPRS